VRELRRIVVGVDLVQGGGAPTRGARGALEQAAWLAKAAGARVALVHARTPDERWDAEAGDFAVLDPGGEERGREVLEAAAAGLRAQGIDTELVVTAESAALAISRCALEAAADLVLVGKRADAPGDERRVGSVSRKLLHECPCAVWVVKPGAPTRPRRVLAATDLLPVGDRAVELAVSLATELGAELHVVHAFQLPFAVQFEGEAAEQAYVQRERERCLARLRAQLEGTPQAGKARVHAGLGSPTRAVVECARRYAVDLVVMGTVARGGVAGLLIGNTAERLLGRLDCSILAVKPADFVSPLQGGAP
jgi:universal stress protein E